ncbi:hypothetical protein [Clostridium magnum]|uniref:hypothetical protein n=1 Tax=Clostridium magnum TaxID=33954 RepID=UPI0009FA3BAB
MRKLAKTELTKQLEKAIKKETSHWFGCLEVTIGWYGNGRVDYMTMDCKEIFRCYELKISKSDFHSEHGHNFVGHFNYYVMPKELYEEVESEIPKHIGIYAWNGSYLSLVKRPKKQELKEDINILKNSMIRSLYRDVCKFYSQSDECVLDRYKRRISKLEKDLRNVNSLYREKSNELYEYTRHGKEVQL